MTKSEMVALPALPRELTAYAGRQAPTYRKLWSMTVDGLIPAEQINGRYQVRRADLPEIAAALGLTIQARDPVAA
jgi:hypothetical protein